MKPRFRPEPVRKHGPVPEPEIRKVPVGTFKESDPANKKSEPEAKESALPGSNPAPGSRDSTPPGGSSANVPSGTPQGVSAVNAATAADMYQKQVLEIIRKNLKYPGNARRRGIEGTVLVRFTIHGPGSVGDVQIVRTSGAALLDKASLETIGRCSFPPPPHGPMTLSVPIVFRLLDEM